MSNHSLLSNLHSTLEQISKVREDGHHRHSNALVHSVVPGTSDIHERVSIVERSLLHLISRLDRIEDSVKRTDRGPTSIDDLLVSSERALREALIEIHKQQNLILQYQQENEALKEKLSGRKEAAPFPASVVPQQQQPQPQPQPQRPVVGNAKPTTTVSSVSKPSASAPKRTANSKPFPTRDESAEPAHKLPVEFPVGYNPQKHAGRRFSVAGESFNPNADLSNVTRNIIKKSNDARNRIRTVITTNILFKNLEDEQLEDLIDEMFEKRLRPDEVIIKQGDDGDNFYVVDSGELYVLYKDVVVATIGVGKGFGEIALMYMCPRTATVKAKTDVILWGMSRATFRRSLMTYAIRKRELYESFLERVPLLESLLPYERSIIADALESKVFKDGELIIREGDPGDAFYIIERGRVVVTKGNPPVEVKSCSEGDYFGELALLTDQPRAANVRAIGQVRVLYLSREDFASLMGPCEEILKRNTQIYNQINATLAGGGYTSGASARVKPKSLQELAKEFAQDEQTYFTGLGIIITEFLKPMRKAVEANSLPISDEELNQLFAHFEMLHAMHQQLASTVCEDIKANPASFGKMLLKAAPGLKFNAEVDRNWGNVTRILDKFKDDARFQSFLKAPNRATFDLASLLSASHERLSKILAYLRDFVGFVPQDTDAVAAMEKIESL